jgi:hypothetical protein
LKTSGLIVSDRNDAVFGLKKNQKEICNKLQRLLPEFYRNREEKIDAN